ncbi:GDP-L-fucose synthase [Devosia rhizoryzae]|uniref:GDP-L-fucose synthase n=1 Tax=Devosia rhizoryzae TaxID=2774137 RepID=A0ABX7CE72_9HYPH|nr:GDP-L-fucose synthase [Devosia rhizoryzae]QQR41112.1 GDP-L-fucose synthase [Devosia rhizoryzae]
MFQLEGKRIWVTGHRGMVGGAIVRRLARENSEIVTIERSELDLRRQDQVEAFVSGERLDGVIIAAGKVGGILANDRAPAEFLYDNLLIEANVIDAAHRAGVEKLLFLGSSCIYPKNAAQPINEDALMTGALEPTNEWYALAKIAGVKLCQAYRKQYGCDFISAMPTNLYGPGDNFDLDSSHVLPALLRKAHIAKQNRDAALTLWGSGASRREFLHVDDCADALVLLLKSYSVAEPVNVGSGEDLSILELARLVSEVVGYRGAIVHDLSKPDGTPRKLLDIQKLLSMGWTPSITLREGIEATYRWFCDSHPEVRAA